MQHVRRKKLLSGLFAVTFSIQLLYSCQPRDPQLIRTGKPSRRCGCAGSLHEFRIINVDWSKDRKHGDIQILTDDSSFYEGVGPLSYNQIAQVVSWADQGWKFDTKRCVFKENRKFHSQQHKNSVRKIKAYYACPGCSPAVCKLEDGTIVKFHFSSLSQYKYISHCFVTNCDYDKATGKFVPHKRQLW